MGASIQEGLLKRLNDGETIDLRADGSAGCGLVMTLQTFAEAVALEGAYQVQEWPLFSSARKGASVRGFLRIGRGPIESTCQIERPQVVLLFSERTAETVDFASGVSEGLFVINSPDSPEAVGRRLRLRGEVVTVPGDSLGQTHLGHPIANIAVLAALQKTIPIVSLDEVVQALEDTGKHRHLPLRAIEANQRCFRAAGADVRTALIEGDPSWARPLPAFPGYAHYPTGAQARLRASLTNQTSRYARAGRRLVFRDPNDKCTGCSLCVINCPEGIIQFVPDPKRGIKVTGAETNQFCKLCRECIEVCPIELFDELGIEELERAAS